MLIAEVSRAGQPASQQSATGAFAREDPFYGQTVVERAAGQREAKKCRRAEEEEEEI